MKIDIPDEWFVKMVNASHNSTYADILKIMYEEISQNSRHQILMRIGEIVMEKMRNEI